MFLDELKLKNAQIVSSQLFDILFPIFLCLFKTINDTFWDFLVKIARNKTHSYKWPIMVRSQTLFRC